MLLAFNQIEDSLPIPYNNLIRINLVKDQALFNTNNRDNIPEWSQIRKDSDK